MTLLLDENLPRTWVSFLSSFQIHSIHWLDIGPVGAPDEQIFLFAASKKAVVITQDFDFTRMLALKGACLPSIIQLRVACPIPETIGTALISVVRDYQQSLEQGCLISLDHSNQRIRLLPIR